MIEINTLERYVHLFVVKQFSQQSHFSNFNTFWARPIDSTFPRLHPAPLPSKILDRSCYVSAIIYRRFINANFPPVELRRNQKCHADTQGREIKHYELFLKLSGSTE